MKKSNTDELVELLMETEIARQKYAHGKLVAKKKTIKKKPIKKYGEDKVLCLYEEDEFEMLFAMFDTPKEMANFLGRKVRNIYCFISKVRRGIYPPRVRYKGKHYHFEIVDISE